MTALRAGAARACITPHIGCHMMGYFEDRLSEDIYDDLYAKAVVFEDGDTSIAIVTLDLVMALREDLDHAKRRASELTGIPPENVFISCTHTHFGPNTVSIFGLPREDEYVHLAMERAGDAVRLAQLRLRPAKVGHASGQCPEETHNRRWLMKDGTVRMNPGYQNPDAVRPAGPSDPEVGTLVVLDEGDTPIAVLANYSLHYVGGPAALTLTADYFGAFDRAIQRMAGHEFVGMMMNGCCGDINNCDFSRPAPAHPSPHYQVERVGTAVASRAYGAWLQIREFTSAVPLAAATRPMTFRRRTLSEEELAEAIALRDSKEDRSDLDWRYAEEQVELSKEPLEQDSLIQSVRVGDMAITGLPGEVFVEIGLAIKERSPFKQTFAVELANDYLGYIPTDKALAEGGYETRLARTAKAAAGTEEVWIETALQTLNDLSEG